MSPAAPRYRIQVVAELTGVPSATLRAWERRYGVPKPARSDGRYRLYSERDLAVIRRMAVLTRSGVRPGEAAAVALGDRGGTVRSGKDLQNRILAAFRAGDGDGLRAALELAFEGGEPGSTFDRIVSPTLVELGRLWEVGEVSIADEHLASTVMRHELTQRVLREPASGPSAFLGCFDEEQHEFGALGLALHVARWGFRPRLLGARVPPSALSEAITRDAPAFVALSLVGRPHVDVHATLAAYRRACGAIPFIVGGAAASDLADAILAHGGHVAPPVAADLQSLVARITQR